MYVLFPLSVQHTVTLLLINLSNSTGFDVTLGVDMNLYPPGVQGPGVISMPADGQREDYHLSPLLGNLTSHVVLLNGTPLRISETGEIPLMTPFITNASSPLHINPSSIAFIRFTNITAPACSKGEDAGN